jgi:hypothetical protein
MTGSEPVQASSGLKANLNPSLTLCGYIQILWSGGELAGLRSLPIGPIPLCP